jgi:hypothetical protein
MLPPSYQDSDNISLVVPYLNITKDKVSCLNIGGGIFKPKEIVNML